MSEKTTKIDGVEYEEMGPYCQLCNAHMGEYYNAKQNPCFINPHKYEAYGDNECPSCKMPYIYDEGNMMKLNEEELDLLRKHRGVT
jgi:hypothetical protein